VQTGVNATSEEWSGQRHLVPGKGLCGAGWTRSRSPSAAQRELHPSRLAHSTWSGHSFVHL